MDFHSCIRISVVEALNFWKEWLTDVQIMIRNIDITILVGKTVFIDYESLDPMMHINESL